MTTNINNVLQVPFLRTSRNFPLEAQPLAVEVNRSYVDVANAVNVRTIGIFSTNRPALTGETWFVIDNQRQQTFRQVYNFTAAGNIAHGISFQNITAFTKPSGSFTDGTNWYGCIFGSNVAIAGQVSFYITPTNIVVLSGAGAPAIVSGLIVLEWMSQT
jgi:hypothetical protein